MERSVNFELADPSLLCVSFSLSKANGSWLMQPTQEDTKITSHSVRINILNFDNYIITESCAGPGQFVFKNGNRQDGEYIQKAPVEGEEEENAGAIEPQWIGGTVVSISPENYIV